MRVIGGANGTTSIFIASSFPWEFIGAALVIAACVTLFLLLRKSRRK